MFTVSLKWKRFSLVSRSTTYGCFVVHVMAQWDVTIVTEYKLLQRRKKMLPRAWPYINIINNITKIILFVLFCLFYCWYCFILINVVYQVLCCDLFVSKWYRHEDLFSFLNCNTSVLFILFNTPSNRVSIWTHHKTSTVHEQRNTTWLTGFYFRSTAKQVITLDNNHSRPLILDEIHIIFNEVWTEREARPLYAER